MGDGFTWIAKVQNCFSKFANDIIDLRLANISAINEGDNVLITDEEGHELAGKVYLIDKDLNQRVAYIDPGETVGESTKKFFSETRCIPILT
jgi:hypothetical protein